MAVEEEAKSANGAGLLCKVKDGPCVFIHGENEVDGMDEDANSDDTTSPMSMDLNCKRKTRPRDAPGHLAEQYILNARERCRHLLERLTSVLQEVAAEEASFKALEAADPTVARTKSKSAKAIKVNGLLTKWFGADGLTHMDVIARNFGKMRDRLDLLDHESQDGDGCGTQIRIGKKIIRKGVVLDYYACVKTNVHTLSQVTKAWAGRPLAMWLGPAFFRDMAGSGLFGPVYDSQQGTILHELTHLVVRTDDHQYGAASCKNLVNEEELIYGILVDQPKKELSKLHGNKQGSDLFPMLLDELQHSVYSEITRFIRGRTAKEFESYSDDARVIISAMSHADMYDKSIKSNVFKNGAEVDIVTPNGMTSTVGKVELLGHCKTVAAKYFNKVESLNSQKIALNNADNYEYFFEEALRDLVGVNPRDLVAVDNVVIDSIKDTYGRHTGGDLRRLSHRVAKEVRSQIKLVQILCEYVLTPSSDGVGDGLDGKRQGWSQARHKFARRLFDKNFLESTKLRPSELAAENTSGQTSARECTPFEQRVSAALKEMCEAILKTPGFTRHLETFAAEKLKVVSTL